MAQYNVTCSSPRDANTYLTKVTLRMCWLLQDFSKAEWEEMQFGIQDTLYIVKAVLVEGMDRAISGVRA